MRELLITKTVGTIQAYTNQGAPLKVCSLISLRFNTQQFYTLFPVLSPDKFNVSNFTKKSYIFTAWPAQRVYILHSLNGTIHQQTQHRKSSCYFQNLFFYTLLCSFFAVFAVWLVLYKNYKPQNTMPKCILSLEYSQLVQLDSGFGVTLHYHHRPSPL